MQCQRGLQDQSKIGISALFAYVEPPLAGGFPGGVRSIPSF